jgi:hypothetical protein
MAYATFKRDREDLEYMRHLLDQSGRLVKPNMAVDLAPKEVSSLRVELKPPAEIRTKEPALFRIHVEQAASGEGVRDLEAYLGAAAHVVIASGDWHHVMHMHAQPGVPRQGGMRETPAAPLPFGPDLGLTQTFDEPGLYKVWVQVQRGGQVITAPFTIEVK